MVYLVVYITDYCEACKRVVAKVKTLSENNPNISFEIKDIKTNLEKTTIVPAVFVNNELFSYGEFEEHSLLRYISSHF